MLRFKSKEGGKGKRTGTSEITLSDLMPQSSFLIAAFLIKNREVRQRRLSN